MLLLNAGELKNKRKRAGKAPPPAARPLHALRAERLAAVALRNGLGQLPRDFVDVMMAEVTLLGLLIIVPGILQRTGAIGCLPLPTKTLLTESAGLAERRPTKAGLSSLLLYGL